MSLPLPPDLRPDAPWRQRFRSPSVLWASVAPGDPDRAVACINRDGAFQIYALDLRTDELRQLSFREEGLANASLSADGRWLLYLQDEGGNEVGHHFRIPWEGGEPQDLVPGLAPYASFAQRGSVDGSVFATIAGNDDGYDLVVSNLAAAEPSPRIVWSTANVCFEAWPSADGSLAVIPVATHSDMLRFDLVAIDVASGAVVGELWDGEGTSIDVTSGSPVPGDHRVAASSDRTGMNRPLIWDPRTGERFDLEIPGAEGEIAVLAWSAGDVLVLKESFRAEDRLWTYDLGAGKARRLNHPPGTYATLGFDAEGRVVVCAESSATPGAVVVLDASSGALERTAVVAGEAPPSCSWRSVTFPTTHDDVLQAWLGLPDGAGPFPTVIETHGGPTAVFQDSFYPPAQVWTDHGYAYLSVNYRGSTGFGREFVESIWGRVGDLEIDDLAASRDWLVAEGIADPERILLTGWSYGGYLTLQGLGRRPELWAGGMAGIAVADWTLMHEDSNDVLRGYLEGILGGPPEAVPEVYRVGSPTTYVEALAAPLLIIQGRNDSRCPARQLEVYEEKARAAGKEIEVDWFDSGHAGWTDVDVFAGWSERTLVFADRVLRGASG